MLPYLFRTVITTYLPLPYLSSLPPESPRITAAIRQHWGIENSLHWVLDVTFAEDACRVRSMHAPHNLALLRRFAKEVLRGKLPPQTLRLNSLNP